MTGYNAYSSSGGTADAITYPLEEKHPIDDLQQVEEAIKYANEALDAVDRLEQINLQNHTGDTIADRLTNLALENYIEKYSIPAAALESELTVSDSNSSSSTSGNTGSVNELDRPQAGKLKKVILYLYAVVQRVFNAIFDFFRGQKLAARKIIPLTKEYIGRADSLSASVASQLNVKDRSLMVALHVDGNVPRKIPQLYDQLAETFEKQHSFSAVSEIIRLVAAAKEKNPERLKKEALELRNKLEEGLKAALNSVNPAQLSIFSEKKTEGNQYYASEPLFGQNYIFGIIGSDVTDNGTFAFRCGIRRDAEIPLRVAAFPVLSPEEIRHICRTSLRICENIIRFSRDEELLQKALREASFLTIKEADETSVVALRNIAAVGQNSYIVYLRYTTRTMQALMRWCGASIKRYEDIGKQ